MRRRLTPSPALLVAVLALLVALSGAAIATVPARDGDVHFCYSKRTGAIEVVDVQRDRFTCERNWRGFIIDSRPSVLTSPDGRVRVAATNEGASLVTPQGEVRLGADGELTIRAGKGVTLDAENTLAIRTARALELRGKTVTTTGADAVDAVTGDASNRMRKDGTITIAGREVQINASGDVTIKGSKVGEN